MRTALIIIPTLALLTWSTIIIASPISRGPRELSPAKPYEVKPGNGVSDLNRVPYEPYDAEVAKRQFHDEDYRATRVGTTPSPSSTASSPEQNVRATRGHRRTSTHTVSARGTLKKKAKDGGVDTFVGEMMARQLPDLPALNGSTTMTTMTTTTTKTTTAPTTGSTSGIPNGIPSNNTSLIT